MSDRDDPHELAEDCPVCESEVRPVARAFDGADVSGWFRVCPTCRYVFEKVPPDVFAYHPSDAPDKWCIEPSPPFDPDE